MKISKELKAGLIVILAIVSFVMFFQFIRGKSLFSSNNIFYIKYDNVGGLEPSNTVSINGLNVGLVNEIKPVFHKNDKISFLVQISVKKDYKFSKNSIIEIYEPSLISPKQLKINLVYDGIFAKNGDTLKGKYTSTLASEITPVKDQVSNTLTSLDSTLVSASKILDEENRRELKILLTNLNHTISSFKETTNHTNKLLVNHKNTISDILNNTNGTMLSANKTVNKLRILAENIDPSKINHTIEKLNITVHRLNNVITNIEQGNGSLGKLTRDDDLYNNLNKTTQSLNFLLEDLKENPKRYINISVFGRSK